MLLVSNIDKALVFVVAHKSTGEDDQVWLTLISSAARLTASTDQRATTPVNQEDEQNNHRPGSQLSIWRDVSRSVRNTKSARGIPAIADGRLGCFAFGPNQSAASTARVEANVGPNAGKVAPKAVSFQRANSPTFRSPPRNRRVCLPSNMLETSRRVAPLSGTTWNANQYSLRRAKTERGPPRGSRLAGSRP